MSLGGVDDGQVTEDLSNTGQVDATESITLDSDVTNCSGTSSNLLNLFRLGGSEAGERTGLGHLWSGGGKGGVWKLVYEKS